MPSKVEQDAVELRVNFRSKTEWDTWSVANQPHFEVWRKEIVEAVKAKGFVEPITRLRRRPEEIKIDQGNLRESISAFETNSRKRAGILALDLARQRLDQRGRQNPKILGTEALTRVARILHGGFRYYLGTEYLPTQEERDRHFPIPHADLANLQYPDATFDLFHSGDVFEHLPDLRTSLVEIARVLRPGGIAVSTFPFTGNNAETRVKARLTGNEVKHLEPPEYHGNPARPNEGALVFSLPGWDILAQCNKAGFVDAAMMLIASCEHGVTSSGAPGVFVLVASK